VDVSVGGGIVGISVAAAVGVLGILVTVEVDEGRGATEACATRAVVPGAGEETLPVLLAWLRRKPPASIPTLRSVASMPPMNFFRSLD
jgi:hypothetical protein